MHAYPRASFDALPRIARMMAGLGRLSVIDRAIIILISIQTTYPFISPLNTWTHMVRAKRRTCRNKAIRYTTRILSPRVVCCAAKGVEKVRGRLIGSFFGVKQSQRRGVVCGRGEEEEMEEGERSGKRKEEARAERKLRRQGEGGWRIGG